MDKFLCRVSRFMTVQFSSECLTRSPSFVGNHSSSFRKLKSKLASSLLWRIEINIGRLTTWSSEKKKEKLGNSEHFLCQFFSPESWLYALRLQIVCLKTHPILFLGKPGIVITHYPKNLEGNVGHMTLRYWFMLLEGWPPATVSKKPWITLYKKIRILFYLAARWKYWKIVYDRTSGLVLGRKKRFLHTGGDAFEISSFEKLEFEHWFLKIL